ncbi:tail fiber protein [Alteromonas sp. ASW11-36]|uniref:Tail fiber protein n=1 Tax=Alteromonas arenosi TaxID=3055817 RepID=A0ABT7SXI1_9ALTE|nr:tail fiber protein [Alteromonas sp. ASW11-36]MDM7860904.1 tail fiber protein [Alteromonas sp. ASW11-36]
MNINTKKHLIVAPLLATTLMAGIQSNALANADPFIGEIQITGNTFCPRGWAEAAGQILPINTNQALFSLLGTTYGGDGRTSFALPDYRGRVPVGLGSVPGSSSIRLGEKGGQETITLTPSNIPQHTHTATTTSTLNASSGRGRTPSPFDAVLADDGNDNVYNSEAPDVAMAETAVTSTTTLGSTGNQPIYNMQPYTTVRYCIALTGTYPSRS